jgi:hypothetical protein
MLVKRGALRDGFRLAKNTPLFSTLFFRVSLGVSQLISFSHDGDFWMVGLDSYFETAFFREAS